MLSFYCIQAAFNKETAEQAFPHCINKGIKPIINLWTINE